MFSRRSHGDIKKSTQKVLDPKKDVLTRLKHLRAVLDNLEWSELKNFFEANYSQIYFIFYENFLTLESNLKLKGNKSQREELDSILFLFEKILQFLPERIFYRWQYHSIGSILKKLLHTGNSVKIRCEGIRLFLLWLQALQTNCGEEQMLMFASLVPGFPAVLSAKGPCTLDTLISSSPNMPDARIYPEEITPLVPAVSGEKIAEDQNCFFFQIVLKYMVIQAASLEWRNKENQDTGFKFLFSLFRKYYLPHIFPSFTKLTNLYKPVLDIPDLRPKPAYVTAPRNNEYSYSTKIPYMAARVIFIKWLVTFFLEKYVTTAQNAKNGADVLPKINQTVTAGNTVQEKNPESETSAPPEQEKTHSNSSTLSDRRLSSSSLCSIEEEQRTVYERVQRILLSTRGYVNFVNEVFRQAFLLPSCDISATRKVVKVYRKWILQEKPVFMEEPDKTATDQVDMQTVENALLDTESKQNTSDHSGHKRSSSWGRTYSFTSAVNRGCIFEDENKDVKAGNQAMLQVFLTNSANVFLLEPCFEVPMLLEEQVDACKAVLSIYRSMIMELTMNKKTWEQMLQILLRITETVMQKPKENQKEDTFSQSLAGLLFRTLIVAWIRANLSVYISRELWDELLSVLSSLTDWEELISEWAKIMDSLTAVLSRTVYGVDMTNLPLDKLSEQKEKKQRGKGTSFKSGFQDSQKGNAVGRSFSLSWRSHHDTLEPMRFRSATTSGAPGVEKARNIVRQKATEVDESQQPENVVGTESSGPLPDQEQLLQLYTRSSSTSDITEQLCSDFCQDQKMENPQNLESSNSKSEKEDMASLKKDSESPVILVRRSSSPGELEWHTDLEHTEGRHREWGKSESISSDISSGYNNEAEVSMMPWQTSEEDHDVHTPTDVAIDSDARHWLQLSPSDATTLTGFGSAFPTLSDSCFQPQLPSVSQAFPIQFETKDSLPLLDENMHQSVLHMPEDLDSSECLADDCSIIAGGNLTGWHPDSAAVLWRRILGILGDVNDIQSTKIHAKVVGYLYELWYKLAKTRDNLSISLDNQSSPSPPVLIPPLRMFASWLFKATTLPNEYKEGKLQAYRLICGMMTRRQDVLPNSDFLVHFYLVMHNGLNNEDQDVVNNVIQHCPSRFFFLGLPGFTMLLGDFITAAARVLSTDMLEAPRVEAQIILGSLVCFPNIYQEIPLLQSVPGTDEIITGNEDIKCYLINILLKNARDEPSEVARCIAICCLGVWICEELVQCTNHPQVKDAINVIGVTLKFSNKVVAYVACDILQLLVSYWKELQNYESPLSRKITEILVATIAFLLPSAEYSSVETDKKFIVSLLLCLLDWCMALPMQSLLEPISTSVLDDQPLSKAPLLDYVYRVLHCCVYGSSTYTQQSHYILSLADLTSIDYDPFLLLGNVKNSEPLHTYSSTDLGNLLTVAEEKKRRSLELIPLTARMVMTQLVNHLGHYPLSGGPAVLHSLISENHDNFYVESSELSSEVFRSPNLQLFVFNDSTLISYLQIPAERTLNEDLAGAASDVRIIVRDISGKYSWDGRILYGPLEDHQIGHNGGKEPVNPNNQQPFESSANTDENEEEEDVLDKLLEKLGNMSPECLLYPQFKLNEPAQPPFGMSRDQENEIIEAILMQSTQEEEHIQRCSSDLSMNVACQEEPSPAEPQAPFYFCRLLLNDLGMNSWDRRKSFHLLKKNSKLLRELKNLDSRQCRETHKIAVFYIAEGQEDKCSILSNTGGSQAYEDFVAGLGWEVDLSTHCGFLGGLQRNGSTGQTAPYYATSTVEAIFHVSTRMPSDSDDSLTKKLRHLGNDEVHIVWSEHSRNYRRGIIPTDFGDVLIIIYPMKNHMFFIEIMKKPEVPFFGPLFDGAIVTAKLLPSLVCATCINASRAVKSFIPLYQSFYEERALYLEAIIQNHREIMTFEDFAAQVFSPCPSYSLSGTGYISMSAGADRMRGCKPDICNTATCHEKLILGETLPLH
ncbi:ral GTPase-activating protein subunit alpha-2 isoform X2 [Rhinatrema bivittatum]|uniref:ral GTPase-activating protein subunit alpha-2 isoform X2 n=1 Tax=Rhinatrema bivittatum TaxID=194408 RepID=UPI00112C4AB8|nr:ral GTPase-activating protein subunit alpha-2 isoform X2 [Rhinatrema bivittatum]